MRQNAAPRKLHDRTLRFGDQGKVGFTSPRWDWPVWGNRILVSLTPNYHGIAGASLLSAKECRGIAAEFERRADDLDAQRKHAERA